MGKSCRLEFSADHNYFMVLAFVNISNFIVFVLPGNFIQICRQKNPHKTFTHAITVGHFKLYFKKTVGNWELVWSTLIRQNDVAML